MKYIGYCRKSTDEKDKQVLSIDQQLSELKEFAEKEHLEIVDFLTEAQTAKVTGRPIFNSLIKRIEKGEAQGIVSWNPDRLARNSVDGGKIIYLLDTGELQSLKFPTHWFENTPQGRFMLSIAFGQAKYYVDNLSQNVHRGLRYKIKQGVWPAKAPMGYRNDRNTKSIVVYEPEARPLKKAFELYSTGKYALDDIGAFLFEHGMKNKYSGGQLNDSNLRRVLMRPFYTGFMVFKGEMYEGTHEAIIDKTLFDKVQKVRKQRGYFHQNKSKRYDFAFTGLIKCRYCGCSITAEHRPFFFPRTNHKADYIYYHCTKKKGECCQKGYTREEKLENQFKEIINSLSVSQSWADQMHNFLIQDIETQKIEDKNVSLRLNQELTETEQKLDRLLEVYLDTTIDSQSYIKKKNELMEKKSFLHSKTKELTSENPFWIEGVKDFIDCAQKCAKIARAENNCHDLADMAKKVGSKYFLKDNTIEFCLNFPYKLLAANGGAASHPTEFVPTLAFGQSKYYVDSLSENTKRGLRQKVRRGEYPSVAPIGYINDVRTKSVVVDRKKAKVIKAVFEYYATGNARLEDVSDFLAQRGIMSRGGKRIHKTRATFILSNPFYTGLFKYGGELHEGKYEPIITKRLFDTAQEILRQRGKPRHKQKNEPQAFCGLISCAECGMMITAEKQKGHTYYRCTKKKMKCAQPYVREEELDRQLSSLIQKVSLRPDWAEKLLAMAEKDKAVSAQSVSAFVQESQNKIRAIQTKLQRLLDGYLEQDIERETYREQKAILLSEKKSLDEKMARIEQKQNDWLEHFHNWIKVASTLVKITRDNDLLQKKVIAKEIFGSNLRLASRAVRGEPVFPYLSAPRAAGSGRAKKGKVVLVAFGRIPTR